MSECTHDCASCGENCGERQEPQSLLKELNPAYADSKAQNQRIDKIEAAISGVADSVRQIQQFLQSSTIKTRKE